jgi:Cu/Ag efflux protein CusF
MKVQAPGFAVLLALTISFAGHANDAHHPANDVRTAAAVLADGEVRKVDKSAGKLTIRHGPLANLDMPAMTMVFQVRDAAMLEQVKAGDKIKFAADKVNGAYTVMQIETVR